jgi:hypothetical protein
MDIIDERISSLINLSREFQLELTQSITEHGDRERLARAQRATTIGVEIEVRFSSYFPGLFKQFGLDEHSYESLSAYDKSRLTLLTNEAEQPLQKNLKRTVLCGVPKGKDRYWEFANRPTYHPYTLSEEVFLLKRANLIPYNQKHSLHITVGGLPFGTDAGILLMILEMLGYTSKERLLSGINPDKAISWGRKGRGGMRRRTTDLEFGYTEAVELRTLEMPKDHARFEELLYITWFLAETIRRPDLRDSWRAVRRVAVELADAYNIDASCNWGPGFENVDKWTKLADSITSMDNTPLWRVVKEVINYQDKLSSKNYYLRDSISW